MIVLLFFFVKQKTAYEMRISDWSSDVCSSDLLVVVDVVQLQQVLLNLIRNAVEAMSESKIRELTIGARQAGDKVIIEISDTGTGIPAAARSEEHTSELQSLMRISYAVFCLKRQNQEITISKAHPQHLLHYR